MIERHELVRRIRLGEDSTLEFNRVLLAGHRITSPNRNEFADELAAMANGWGGTAVLGVEDRGREVLGIPLNRLDTVETWAREICNDSVKPPLDALIRKMELPGAAGGLVAVICIEISAACPSTRARAATSAGTAARSGICRRKCSRGCSRSAVKVAESLRRVAGAWNLAGTTG